MVRRLVVRSVSDQIDAIIGHEQDVAANAAHVCLASGVCLCKYADV